jgi:hypothetical protein
MTRPHLAHIEPGTWSLLRAIGGAALAVGIGVAVFALLVWWPGGTP